MGGNWFDEIHMSWLWTFSIDETLSVHWKTNLTEQELAPKQIGFSGKKLRLQIVYSLREQPSGSWEFFW